MENTEELTDVHIKIPVKIKRKFQAATNLKGTSMTAEFKKFMIKYLEDLLNES